MSDDLVYPITGTLDLADAAELTQLDRPDLKVDSWAPLARPPLSGLDADDQFATIRAGDLLVHHPYDSFAASFESFLNASAADPKVIGIKSTVYRTGDDTPLVPALIEASENGKQSVCLVEIKARGDERRNIEWSRALEQAGVHVVYGFPTLKIHAKMTLVVRRESGELRRYVHLGTGNYNRATARAYEDFGVFTADEEIAADVADLFNYLTGFGHPAHFRKLLVAPFGLRQRLVEEIRGVADAARAGAKARIRIKVNGLTHVEVIDELYAASEAGARIDLLVRGVCSLRPGISGSEREHPRAERPRTVPRAQPAVRLRGRRPEPDAARQRRPDAAQPRPPRRGADAGRLDRDPVRDRRDTRHAARRHGVLVGAPGRRNLAARPSEEGGAATLRPGNVDAPRTPASVARTFALSPESESPERVKPSSDGEPRMK